jgi:hypothetical protein
MKSCILILGSVLVLLASSCSVAAQKSETTQEVSYCDLVKAPEQFVGKHIRVRAIYKYGFEMQRLAPPACCPERGAKIWVEIKSEVEGDSLKLYRKFPKGMGLALATFEGKFDGGGPYGDGGYRLKLTVEKIETVEATAKPSAHHDPAWVPKNCETSNAAPSNPNTSTVLHEAQHSNRAGESFETHPGYVYDAPQ